MSAFLVLARLPIWTLYLTGLPGFFGGNFDTGLAVIFASYSDVIPSQSESASLFFLTTSMQYVAQVVCPAIGAILMNLDGKGGTPEIAYILAFSGALTSVCLALFLYPETLPKGVKNETRASNNSSRIKGDYSICAWMKSVWSNLVDLMKGIGVGNMLLLGISTFSVVTGTRFLDWYGLIQYPVIKLGWSLSMASFSVSVQAVIMLVNFSILLPLYVRVCGQYFSPSNASLFIVYISCLVLAVGATITGLSSSAIVFLPAMVAYSLGEGAAVTMQAYVASLIDKSRLARVMGMLSVASIGGKMAASGGFQKILAIGLDTHQANLVGLPFFVAAVLFLIAGTSIVIVAARALSIERQKTEREQRETLLAS
ncbi:MAG: hypothetical protein MMC33_008692 [Icmadophila ericetorum]|nr:hypothetical protein [Icmadophila ericetorum]